MNFNPNFFLEEEPENENPDTVVDETENEDEIEDVEDSNLADEQDEDEDTSEDDDDSDQESETVETPFRDLAKMLYTHNKWDWDDNDMKGDDVDSFLGLIQEIVAENSKPQYSDPVVEAFDKYISEGGDATTFLEHISNSGNSWVNVNYSTLNLEDESIQKKVVGQYIKLTTNWSDNKINKYIDNQAKLGELKEEALTASKDLTMFAEKQKKAEFEKLEKEKQQRIQEYKEYTETVTNIISNTDFSSLGYKLNNKDRNDLYNFVMNVDPGTKKTKYQQFAEDPKNGIALALLAMKGVTKGKLPDISESKERKKLVDKLNKSTKDFVAKKQIGGNVVKRDSNSFLDSLTKGIKTRTTI